MATVTHAESIDRCNHIIRIPTNLILDDGRKLLVTEWHPHVVLNEIVKVTLTAIVEEDGMMAVS